MQTGNCQMQIWQMPDHVFLHSLKSALLRSLKIALTADVAAVRHRPKPIATRWRICRTNSNVRSNVRTI